jgi:ubiquitin carboxyl-terminal hydrolase 48
MLLLQKPKYGGGPTLSNDDCCMECLMMGAKKVVSADDYRDRKASFKNLAETALAGSCSDDPSYFVSRTWYVKCILLLISNLSSV